MMYRQCGLRKDTLTGEMRTTSYLPQRYAVVGKIVQLRNKAGVWSDGWEVVSAGELVAGEAIEGQAHKSGNIWKATSGDYPRGNK